MIDWIIENKEWLFSGGGIVIIGMIIPYIIKKVKLKKMPPKIRETPIHKEKKSNNERNEKDHSKSRIALICSTTEEISNSPEKSNGLKIFYSSLLKTIERTTYGINTCGAEPLRGVFFKNYCEQLYNTPREDMKNIEKTVRWYWYRGDKIGLNFEPAYYESCETKDQEERTIKEITDSDIIVALAGRIGTRSQIERLLMYHKKGMYEINLEQKPLILLGWFGGTVKKFIDKNLKNIKWILDKYSDLEPMAEYPEWEKGDTPNSLAIRLVEKIGELLENTEK